MHWIHNDFQHIRLGFAWNTVFVTQTKRISLFPLRTNQVMFCQSLKTEFMLVNKNTFNLCSNFRLTFYLMVWIQGIQFWPSVLRFRIQGIQFWPSVLRFTGFRGFRGFNFDLLFWDSGFRGFSFDLLFGFSFGDSVKTASNAWDSVFRDACSENPNRIRTKHMFCNTNTMNYYIILFTKKQIVVFARV